MKGKPLVPRKRTPRAELFWRKVKKDCEGGCWLWTASKNHKGYGMFSGRTVDGKPLRDHAHRFSYELTHEPIPVGMWVLHRCDTPACVNPQHLFLGTAKENSRDMVNKGRNFQATHPERVAKGEATGHAKVTANDVPNIRRMRDGGAIYSAIGQIYGITPQAVFHICKGTNWRHIQ